jgi:hypothetical protein
VTPLLLTNINVVDTDSNDENSSYANKHGQWIRRRLLDGSLNRVPIGFYTKVWAALEKVCNPLTNMGTIKFNVFI